MSYPDARCLECACHRPAALALGVFTFRDSECVRLCGAGAAKAAGGGKSNSAIELEDDVDGACLHSIQLLPCDGS